MTTATATNDTTEAASQPTLQQLIEHIDDWRTDELVVDAAARVVRQVALTGTKSRNGYRYSEQALQEALPLYENKPVFLDHAANVARPYDRSTRDLVGSIVHARYVDGRIRGDIQVLDTEAGRVFLALVESNRPPVGMSHVVVAQRNGDKSVVEKIHDVVSVDAVVFPATTTSFREQTEQPTAAVPVADCDSLEVDDVLAQVEAYWPEHARRLKSHIEAVTAERNERRHELESLRIEHEALRTEREVAELLKEAHLPEFALSDLFRRQLLAASGSEERRAILVERQALLKQCEQQPHSRERRDGHAGPASDAAIVSSLKRRPQLRLFSD